MIRNLINKVGDVRQGEWRALAWSALLFFLILAGYYLVRPVRDAIAAEFPRDVLGDLFWITLGALLVLRSSAGATSATALQAVAGTLMGFVVASIILWTAETSVGPLWAILPASIFLAGYAPGAIGFMIGQASFTTALVVLFTLIYPAGIDTAIERVETVTLGAISAAVIGLLLWPHGARAALAATVARVYRTAAAGMRGLLGGT